MESRATDRIDDYPGSGRIIGIEEQHSMRTIEHQGGHLIAPAVGGGMGPEPVHRRAGGAQAEQAGRPGRRVGVGQAKRIQAFSRPRGPVPQGKGIPVHIEPAGQLRHASIARTAARGRQIVPVGIGRRHHRRMAGTEIDGIAGAEVELMCRGIVSPGRHGSATRPVKSRHVIPIHRQGLPQRPLIYVRPVHIVRRGRRIVGEGRAIDGHLRRARCRKIGRRRQRHNRSSGHVRKAIQPVPSPLERTALPIFPRDVAMELRVPSPAQHHRQIIRRGPIAHPAIARQSRPRIILAPRHHRAKNSIDEQLRRVNGRHRPPCDRVDGRITGCRGILVGRRRIVGILIPHKKHAIRKVDVLQPPIAVGAAIGIAWRIERPIAAHHLLAGSARTEKEYNANRQFTGVRISAPIQCNNIARICRP